MNKSLITFCLFAAFITGLGGYFIFRTTCWSPWAFSDSGAYLSAARNFDAGKGLIIQNANGSTTRVTEFAPLYPLTLAMLTGPDGDYIQTARWLDMAAFALSIIVLGVIVFLASKRALLAAIVMLLFSVNWIIVEAYSGIMSEALFFLLLLIQIFFLWVYLTHSRLIYFSLLIFFSMILPLVRYAGVIFPICAGAAIILFGAKRKNQNLIYGSTLAFLSVFPIGLYFLNLYLTLEKVGGKRFALDFSLFNRLLDSLHNVYLVSRQWMPYFTIYENPFIDNGIQIFFTIGFLGLMVIGSKRAFQNRKDLGSEDILFLIGALFTLGYAAFIAFTHAITIPQIDIINRMLSPLIPLALIMTASVFASTESKSWNKYLSVPILLITAVIIRYNLLVALDHVDKYSQDGYGFNSREVQESGFLEEIFALEKDQPMVSNSAAFVLFHINRYPLPVSQFHNRPFGSGDAYGERTFRERGAPLIIHLPDFYNTYGPEADQLLSNLTNGLREAYSGPIGAIYYYPDSATQP